MRLSDRTEEIRTRLVAACAIGDRSWPAKDYWDSVRKRNEDADLIAHAPNDISWLLDELSAANSRADGLQTKADSLNIRINQLMAELKESLTLKEDALKEEVNHEITILELEDMRKRFLEYKYREARHVQGWPRF